MFKDLSQMLGVRVLHPERLLCDDGRCRTLAGGAAPYMDDDHLSPLGAELLTDLFREALTPGA